MDLSDEEFIDLVLSKPDSYLAKLTKYKQLVDRACKIRAWAYDDRKKDIELDNTIKEIEKSDSKEYWCIKYLLYKKAYSIKVPEDVSLKAKDDDMVLVSKKNYIPFYLLRKVDGKWEVIAHWE